MRTIGPAVLSCLMLAACGDPPADPRGVDHDEVLLQVMATGRTDSRPDEARFTAGVSTIGATAGAASSVNSATINRVVKALEGLGVKPDDVQTRSITLSRIDYGRDRGRYQANNLIEVRVRDLKRAGEAIAATTEAGANVLSGPDLRVSDPEAASRSAYAQAYKAARARAEAYAGAAGLKVARVLTIRDTGDGGEPPPYYGDAAMNMEQRAVATAAPPVMPGVSSREVRVRADFALTAE
jgi:uncharacterized protein YggE